jgi:hypothetical protein
MIVYRCDLCGETKECLLKEIDGKEYDICAVCWNPLAEELSGKGRVKKSRETVLLPPPRVKEKEDEPKPMPGEPPKIWCGQERPN